MIKLQTLLNRIDCNTLVEVVLDDTTLFYGIVKDIELCQWSLFNKLYFLAMNCFVANTSPQTKEAIIQIFTTYNEE